MYIAIEGVIGVGKTTLARLLQSSFDAELLLEIFEENPFLSDFYGDRERYAFQTQIFFLLSRYHQQHQAVPKLLSRANLIADYTFAKDSLFAKLNLKGDELDTYFQVHNALAERIVQPDLIVFLRVETEVALQRIALRDRSYERNMDRSYIHDLNLTYENFFNNHPELPILTVDTTRLDFVQHSQHLEQVTNKIRQAMGIPPYQPQLPLEGGDGD